MLVAVDCAQESRIPEPALRERAPRTINIDHHHDNTRFGDVDLVVEDASSTGEVLADLFAAIPVGLTPAIAEALYTAIVTDTGRFQYSNTTPKSLRLAAELVEAGADVSRVFLEVYESTPFPKLKLLARALERATAVRRRPRPRLRARARRLRGRPAPQEPYSEGIIDHLRSVEGTELVALVRELPPGAASARKGSLRSHPDGVDVSAIARAFGGGGHKRAAGFSTDLADGRDHAPDRRRVRRRERQPRRLIAVGVPKGLEPTGVILADKPAGPSSFAVVARVRGRTGAKTGHAGTLDPFATGLLILLSGRATTLQDRFMKLDKRYLTEIDLHGRTTTGDPEGEPLDEQEPPAADALEESLATPARRGRAADPRRVRREDRRRAGLSAPPPRGGGRDAHADDADP